MKVSDEDFNDEFLKKGSDDYERAKRLFPEIMFALQSDDVFEPFFDIDEEANREKRAMLRAGYITIALGLISLWFATIEMSIVLPAMERLSHCSSCEQNYWLERLPIDALRWGVFGLALTAGAFGVASFLVGYFRGGTGRRKLEWLEKRGLGEAFRQWRWRYYLANVDAIVDAVGNEEKERAYEQRWLAARDDFLSNCRTDLRLEIDKIVRGESGEDIDALVDVPNSVETSYASSSKSARIVPMITEAYDQIRVRSQLRYTHFLIFGEGRFSRHPATQIKVLHSFETALVVLVFGLHALIMVGILLGITALKSPTIYLLAICAALAVLAAMCLERGLRASAHLGRLKGYRAEVLSLQDQILVAEDQDEKLRHALRVEAAATKEMIEFLQEGNRARFLI